MKLITIGMLLLASVYGDVKHLGYHYDPPKKQLEIPQKGYVPPPPPQMEKIVKQESNYIPPEMNSKELKNEKNFVIPEMDIRIIDIPNQDANVISFQNEKSQVNFEEFTSPSTTYIPPTQEQKINPVEEPKKTFQPPFFADNENTQELIENVNSAKSEIDLEEIKSTALFAKVQQSSHAESFQGSLSNQQNEKLPEITCTSPDEETIFPPQTNKCLSESSSKATEQPKEEYLPPVLKNIVNVPENSYIQPVLKALQAVETNESVDIKNPSNDYLPPQMETLEKLSEKSYKSPSLVLEVPDSPKTVENVSNMASLDGTKTNVEIQQEPNPDRTYIPPTN